MVTTRRRRFWSGGRFLWPPWGEGEDDAVCLMVRSRGGRGIGVGGWVGGWVSGREGEGGGGERDGVADLLVFRIKKNINTMK